MREAKRSDLVFHCKWVQYCYDYIPLMLRMAADFLWYMLKQNQAIGKSTSFCTVILMLYLQALKKQNKKNTLISWKRETGMQLLGS